MDKDGLFLCGTVAGRSKAYMGEKKTEVVTYKILADGKDFYVKEWEPHDQYYAVGECIEVPIIIKPYMKNGNVRLDYTIFKERIFGEEF